MRMMTLILVRDPLPALTVIMDFLGSGTRIQSLSITLDFELEARVIFGMIEASTDIVVT